MSPELITELTQAILSVVLILISAYVIPWLKNKIGEDKYINLIDFAEIVVRSAEKIYTPEQWQEKKKYAMNAIIQKAKDIGLNLSEEELNAIIEGAVHAVKG
jgi:hypothetical protein